MDDTSNFVVSTVRDALADVTNVQNTKNIEVSALAREKGRVEPKDYDYEKYVTVIPSEKPAEKGENYQDEQSFPEWAANAVKYEWNDEYGDVGPENPHLEEQLFRAEFINRTGLKIENLQNIDVVAESHERPSPIRTNICLCGYEFPTPIQAYAIPAVLTSHDLIAIAQTGSP
ncbi:hypothetical protein AN9445.2 [Aspergillus nidulans FGSC A4]|nr:hypothetical protein AN9445.2 [Aspergillus nidulans FGSC A4]|eukprot:XP_868827.1 hypothetical protein AN9445.2 [Aspergillus nidulans FGSC A4]